jgi:hypothetical protein
VTLFGVLKRRLGYKLPFEDERETVKSIMKGYHDFKETMVEPNIWGAFRAIGLEFEFDIEAEPYRFLFNEEKLRQSAGFLGRWSIDFPWIDCRVRVKGRMPDLAGSTSKNKVIWPKSKSLSLIRCRDIVVCQKTKKRNCGGIHRITWRALWVFKFFIRYYGEFTFYSCSIDVPILSYGQIFSGI